MRQSRYDHQSITLLTVLALNLASAPVFSVDAAHVARCVVVLTCIVISKAFGSNVAQLVDDFVRTRGKVEVTIVLVLGWVSPVTGRPTFLRRLGRPKRGC